jgi:hypothetical protein
VTEICIALRRHCNCVRIRIRSPTRYAKLMTVASHQCRSPGIVEIVRLQPNLSPNWHPTLSCSDMIICMSVLTCSTCHERDKFPALQHSTLLKPLPAYATNLNRPACWRSIVCQLHCVTAHIHALGCARPCGNVTRGDAARASQTTPHTGAFYAHDQQIRRCIPGT